MRKELGDDQVRITVRMSREMYQALRTVARERWGWGSPGAGALIRDALRHYVACPDRFREADAERAARLFLPTDHHD